jgi:hypothetical protein
MDGFGIGVEKHLEEWSPLLTPHENEAGTSRIA